MMAMEKKLIIPRREVLVSRSETRISSDSAAIRESRNEMFLLRSLVMDAVGLEKELEASSPESLPELAVLPEEKR